MCRYICICVRVERECVSLRNWFMRLLKLESLKSVGQAGNPGIFSGTLMLHLEFEVSLEAEFSLLWRKSVFFLLRSVTDWARTTHMMECNPLDSEFTDFSVTLI